MEITSLEQSLGQEKANDKHRGCALSAHQDSSLRVTPCRPSPRCHLGYPPAPRCQLQGKLSQEVARNDFPDTEHWAPAQNRGSTEGVSEDVKTHLMTDTVPTEMQRNQDVSLNWHLPASHTRGATLDLEAP